jgi:hypothetical protein
VSTTVDVPEPLAGRLAAEAARRGLSVDEVAVEALEGAYGRTESKPAAERLDALEAFIGGFDSGDPDWAATDTHELRAQATVRRPA